MKFERILPHLLAIVVCLLMTVAYFKPAVLDGKTLPQGDVMQSKGMQTEIMKYYEQTGEYPRWTNQMFVGMPSYQIYGGYTGNYVSQVGGDIYFLFGKYDVSDPHILFFWLMLLGYIGLLMFGTPPWVAITAAVSFGLMTNNLVLMEAGHCNKVFALSFTLPVLGAAWQVLRGRLVLGGAAFALFVALQVGASHVQIVYYTFFIIAFMAVVALMQAIREQTIPTFAKAIGVLAVGTALGVGSNLMSLWTTYEYAEESIRGKSELVKADTENTNGLSKDYIFGWSYGKLETFTLLIPHFMGGTSNDYWVQDKKSNTAAAFATISRQLPPEAAQNLAQFTSKYWGAQPFTSGPVYFGAVLMFLAVLGLALSRNPIRWGLGGAVLFLMVLAWGKNFAGFNNLMVDYFPFYNKFRAVTMTLTVAQVLIIVLAGLGLQAALDANNKADYVGQWTKEKLILLSAAIVGGLCALGLLYSFVGDLGTQNEDMRNYIAQAQAQAPEFAAIFGQLEDAMYADRAGLIRSDAIKSLLFVALSAGMLWLVAKERLNAMVALLVVGGASVVDFSLVDALYLNDKTFVAKKQNFGKPPLTPADQQILQDKDPYFRVLDLRGNPMNNAYTSYYHKSVGGYHAAKPILFQEVVDKYKFVTNPQSSPQILAMLNTKYYIVANPQDNNQIAAIPNTEAIGNAWFVDKLEVVANANAELDSLATLFPRTTALVQKKYESYLQGLANTPAPNDKIYLTAYHPEKLTYTSETTNERFAVFSEIYYPPTKGWAVYIDGNKVEDGFIKVDYLLRGMRVPAGKHTIEMRFEPRSVSLGTQVAVISSVLILVGLAGGLFLQFRQSNKEVA